MFKRRELRIALSKSGFTVLRSMTGRNPVSTVLLDYLFSADESFPGTQLSTLFKDADCAGWPARVILADELTRSWMVTPPQNAVSLADCQVAASVRFQHLYGESLAGWQMTANWNAKLPFLACALPESVMTQLNNLSKESRLIIIEVAPQSIFAWNHDHPRLQPDHWLGVLQQQRLTYMITDARGIIQIREIILPKSQAATALPTLLNREALRLNVEMPATLLLYGDIPASWPAQRSAEFDLVCLNEDQTPVSPGIRLAMTGLTA